MNTSPKLSASALSRQINVTAESKVLALPDVAYFNVEVITLQNSPESARELNATAMNEVFAVLAEQKIPDTDIQTVHFNASNHYEYVNNKRTFRGFRVANRLKVTLRDLAIIGETIDKLLSAGATDVSNISFGLLDEATAYDAALTQALALARHKAQLIAKLEGVQLGALVSVQEVDKDGPMVFNASVRTMSVGSTPTEINSGEVTVTAQVRVSYSIE